MDIPILKYLDILIGISVAMLLVSTVVMAIVQAYLGSSYARARHLLDGLEELIGLLDSGRLGPHKLYIAQRLLRHPLVSRENTLLGEATSGLRNLWRRRVRKLPGLPSANPGNVLQREELIWILLEWCAGEGPLANQDQALLRAAPEEAGILNLVRSDLILQNKYLLSGCDANGRYESVPAQ